MSVWVLFKSCVLADLSGLLFSKEEGAASRLPGWSGHLGPPLASTDTWIRGLLLLLEGGGQSHFPGTSICNTLAGKEGPPHDPFHMVPYTVEGGSITSPLGCG